MRIACTDPITGKTLTNPDGYPYVVQGEGPNALKIFFESEESRKLFLDIETENPGCDFATKLDNPGSTDGVPKKRH